MIKVKMVMVLHIGMLVIDQGSSAIPVVIKNKIKNDKNQNGPRAMPAIGPEAGGAPRILAVVAAGNAKLILKNNKKSKWLPCRACRYAGRRPRGAHRPRGK